MQEDSFIKHHEARTKCSSQEQCSTGSCCCVENRYCISCESCSSSKRNRKSFFLSVLSCEERIAHTTNFEPLLDLFRFLGMNIKAMLGTPKNATYTSDKSIQDMLYVISEVLETKILDDLKSSKHFALQFDETLDCTTTEQLAVHGRFVDEESRLLRSHYLKIIDVLQPESTDGAPVNESYDTSITLSAETITNRIIEYTDGAQLDMTKLKGIGTDGAATMTVVRNGGVTRLKAVSLSSIGVHCAAHRLNLAAPQAGNAVPYVKKFNIIICQIFDFFDNSCVRTAGLRAVQSLLQEKGKLTAPSTT